MTRVTCVISSLGGGGAEKIMTILAEGLVQRGYQVSLLTLNSEVKDFYSVPHQVERVKLMPEAVIECRWFRLGCQLKRHNAFKESILRTSPDVVISFMDLTNIRVLSALSGTGVPILVSEHTDPRYYNIGFRWELMRHLWYPRAANVVMLTNETMEWAKKQWPRWKASAIPNPVLPPAFSPNPVKPKWFGKYNLIAMGRLVKIKGYDMLLKAFELIADDFPDWNLTILGEGELRREMEEAIARNSLKDRVFLPGTINPPYDVLKQADLLVMSSRFEGFPNAICEAMACGLPVVSFDCPSGPRAIIRHGVDGVLVPPEDVNALALALRNLMEDESKRRKLAERAPEILERFSLGLYLDRWEALISAALSQG